MANKAGCKLVASGSVGSTPTRSTKFNNALVAQMVERWPEESGVDGSNPSRCTKYIARKVLKGKCCGVGKLVKPPDSESGVS